MWPFLIFCSPAIALSIVVFPIPDGPNKQIMSPSFSIENDIFLTFVFPSIIKSTFFTSKKLSIIFS